VELPEVLVIGAGPAGLAAAAMLTRFGFRPVVLEQAETAGASWAGRYDRLRLNTIRWMSSLPGARIPRRSGRWVSRDDYVAYLRRYATRWPLDLRFRTRAERIERDDFRWRVDTDRGALLARDVVVATGYNHTPAMPGWPGRHSFHGKLVHAAFYRNAAPFVGCDVLVVGSGNSGTEIALDLLEGGAARVRLSMRRAPTILRREWHRLPMPPVAALARRAPRRLRDAGACALQRLVMGDLCRHRLAPPALGVSDQVAAGRLPNIDSGFVDAVRRGEIDVIPAVEAFEGRDVILTGQLRTRTDVVIAATAYERGLERLVGHLGVLGHDGRPVLVGDETKPEAPGLYFIGYKIELSGHLPELGHDARRVARAIAAERQLGALQ
jgi:putative flavoprotein involved in K+ transport